MSNQPEPIERHRFDMQQLVTEHPPRWEDRNKKIVFAIACPAETSHQGRLEYSRWAPLPLPESLNPKSAVSRVVAAPGFYDYARTSDPPDAVEWHVNFADSSLFVAYGSRLFAQDEMQVAEHPAPGSLKEALIARNLPAHTVDGNEPTPVLVMGALRHCRVATEPNAAEGRPHGLYGNAFARADPEAVRRATSRIDPPTTTNLVAIAAPSYGAGRYRMSDLEYVLHTAFTGFRAAVLESGRSRGSACPVVIHSGFWGCGAFGGNRVLMTTLQVIAAEMAGVEQIVFHTGDPSGDASISEMRRLFDSDVIGGPTVTVRELIQRIHGLGFEWGVSDGN
jgi:Poly (ADP-ribose) glycohydrolase (PARG)